MGADGVVRLFACFDRHLATLGLHGKEGLIVDASFVEVPRQRNSRGDNQAIKEGGVPEEWEEKPAKLRQKDTNARWAKKNSETHYGYKNHIKCDAKTKLSATTVPATRACTTSSASRNCWMKATTPFGRTARTAARKA